MSVIKCKMCGGDLKITYGNSIAVCEYCGTKQTVPNDDDNKKLALFTRANKLRAMAEFDKASYIYESIVAEFPEEAEAYWGLVLCKYGIEYVDDPATGKKIPTCHRSSFESIMDDADFDQVLENADSYARKVYRDEAKQIEEIRKGIIEVSSKEEPYDIFICYKETDENGERTLDSVIAQDIYDALTAKNYRVFFSRITLEDKLGQEYEPYIFAALNSAKIMLAVGTDYEYYNSVWVKNEWSRYLKLMAEDKNKHLIPCFRDLDAYDIPKEFAKLQAQDMGKVGAMQDLMRGIEKLISSEEKIADLQAMGVDGIINQTLAKAKKFLRNSEWDSASKCLNTVLGYDPDNAQALMGCLMCDLKIRTEEDFADIKTVLADNRNYQEVLKNADDELKENLEEYNRYSVYNTALANADSTSVQLLENSIKQLESISGWKDSDKKAEELRRKLNKSRNKIKKIICSVLAVVLIIAGTYGFIQLKKYYLDPLAIYKNGVAYYEDDNFKQSAIEFGKIGNFKNSNQKSREIWNDKIINKNVISVGDRQIVGITVDGKVQMTGFNPDCNVSFFNNIIEIESGSNFVVGLRSDGKVLCTGRRMDKRFEVSDWDNITSISVGKSHTVGVRSDGTVVATGKNDFDKCNVSEWNNVIQVRTGDNHTVGLKLDGSVFATGNNESGQCNVDDWNDIVLISAGGNNTIGLKVDGTLVSIGANEYNSCNTSKWIDIISVSTSGKHTVGLKSDGTVVAVGNNKYGQCDTSNWHDVISISTGDNCTIGVKSDGTVIFTGKNYMDKYDFSNWKAIKRT